jgi:hypothetical protein
MTVDHPVNLDFQVLFNWSSGLLIIALSWFFNQVWSDQKKASTDMQSLETRFAKDLKELEVGIPATYVRRDEFTQALRDVKEMLIRIDDKIDDKADKQRDR